MKTTLLEKKFSRQQLGQGFIETIIALGIIIILFHALSSLIIATYDLLGNTRTRTTARHLANERIEEIRNLPYASIGVVGGIPPGVLPQTQTFDRNGQDYLVRTSVIFIDDPFDLVAPADQYPGDYKRARVDVSWTGRFVVGESLTLLTDIASDEITGGGTLSILVFDANALPVPQAQARILNTLVNPQIDLELLTDNAGRVTLPGSPPCNLCYEITVSKTDFNGDRTYSTTEVANPSKPHASVVEGQLTEVSFAIDHTATLNITSTRDRQSNFTALAGKSFILQGGKIIGTDSLGDPVYKYLNQLQTDAGGNLVLQNIEWDSYKLALPEADSWDLTGTNPLRPIIVTPSQNLNLAFASASHTLNTLLLAVTDASGSAIASASARLTGPGNYDQTIFTGESQDPDFGQAFFSPLTAGSYTLNVSKLGYNPKTDNLSVSNQTEYSIQLDAL